MVFEIGLTLVLHLILLQFSSHEKADEAEAFFTSRVTAESAMNLKQNIEQVRIKARWVESIKQEEYLEALVRGFACIWW